MRPQARLALGMIGMMGLLSGCMTDARAAGFMAPEDYGTVEQLVADADVVALVQAGDAAVDVVDRVPYTRTEVQLRKVLLGAVAKNANLAVTQVGARSSPPAAGLPIPHVTTPWDLEVQLGEAAESLGTSVIGSY